MRLYSRMMPGVHSFAHYPFSSVLRLDSTSSTGDQPPLQVDDGDLRKHSLALRRDDWIMGYDHNPTGNTRRPRGCPVPLELVRCKRVEFPKVRIHRPYLSKELAGDATARFFLATQLTAAVMPQSSRSTMRSRRRRHTRVAATYLRGHRR